MSTLKDTFEIIEKILTKLVPYFLKTEKDIQLYKSLKEQTEDIDEKKEYDKKIKDLLVYKVTKGSFFSNNSIRSFNKKHPNAQLHSHHFKFISDQEHRLVKIKRDTDGNIIIIQSLISKEKQNKDELVYARNMILGFFIMLIPSILKSAYVTTFFSKNLPTITNIIENKEIFLGIAISCFLITTFMVIRSIKNVFDLYTLQELIKYKVIEEVSPPNEADY